MPESGIMNKKALIAVNIVIVVLETIALIHDCYAFGISLFEWYTVDSNVLQLIVSVFVVLFWRSLREGA